MFWYRDDSSNRYEVDLYMFDSLKPKTNSIALKSVQPREELSAVLGGDLDGPYRTILEMREQDLAVPIYENAAITRRNGQ